MNYRGGKHIAAPHFVNAMLRAGVTTDCKIVEPFCGACSVTARFCDAGFRDIVAADGNESLALLWQSVMERDAESFELDLELYEMLRNGPDCPERALACIGAAFGGAWLGPMNKNNPQHLLDRCVRSVNRKAARMRGKVDFFHALYRELPETEDHVYYCDPPYRTVNKTGFKGIEFDHDDFYAWVEVTARRNVVFVSEYSFPLGEMIFTMQTPKFRPSSHKGAPPKQTEKLFMVSL